MSKAFYNFVTEPKDMLGYGVEYSWMWQDFDKLGDALGKTFDKPNGQIDPEKLIPYAKAVHDRGQGFVYYGHDFMAWKDIDVEGLKAIGGIA